MVWEEFLSQVLKVILLLEITLTGTTGDFADKDI